MFDRFFMSTSAPLVTWEGFKAFLTGFDWMTVLNATYILVGIGFMFFDRFSKRGKKYEE